MCLLAVGGSGAEVAGALLIHVGMIVPIGGAVLAGATRGVFDVALYRYVAEDRALARSRHRISRAPPAASQLVANGHHARDSLDERSPSIRDHRAKPEGRR